MKKLIAFFLICSNLTLGEAHAVPARPLYEPPAPPQPPRPIDLRGTTWDSQTKAEDRLFVFQSDGTLRYGAGHSNGLWRMEGNTVYVEINNAYRFFRGTVQGDVIEGESWNIRGLRWRTRLERTKSRAAQ